MLRLVVGESHGGDKLNVCGVERSANTYPILARGQHALEDNAFVLASAFRGRILSF